MMKSAKTILKWATVLILALSAVFFFLPYRSDKAPIEIINLANQANLSEYVIEGIMLFIVPLVLTLFAALMMALRVSIPKCVIAAVSCVIAFVLLWFYKSDTVSKFMDVGIGQIGSLIIAAAGVVLPIVNAVLSKVSAANKATSKA